MTTVKVKQIDLCEHCLKNRATINFEYYGPFNLIIKTRLLCNECYRHLRQYRRLADYKYV